MKFSEAMALFEQGKDVRRKTWMEIISLKSIDKNEVRVTSVLAMCDVYADDWEVVEELVNFNTMIEHLKKGGKAQRKAWIKAYPEGYWYADGDNIRENINHAQVFLDLSTNSVSDWILL